MESLIQEFIEYLGHEKGLATNTLESYGRDLRQYCGFLSEDASQTPETASQATIVAYLMMLRKQGKATATIARRLAALKAFYQFMLKENYVTKDPTDELSSPKLERKLPKVLTVDEVDKLLNQPDTSTPAGIRDKAMLEVLYATGIRVSELVSLNLGDIDFNEGFVRCIGKGSKERVVPMGELAINSLKAYLSKGRPKLAANPEENALFLNHHGRRLTRQGFWKIVKKYAAQLGSGRDYPSHASALICHPLAGERGGYQGGPGDARPCRYFDHPDLHPCDQRQAQRRVCQEPPKGIGGAHNLRLKQVS